MLTTKICCEVFILMLYIFHIQSIISNNNNNLLCVYMCVCVHIKGNIMPTTSWKLKQHKNEHKPEVTREIERANDDDDVDVDDDEHEENMFQEL